MGEKNQADMQTENVTVVPTPGTTIKKGKLFSVSSILYAKEEQKQKVEDDFHNRVIGDERIELIAFAKKQWNIDKADLPDWVMSALRLRKAGKSVILGIRRFSERTLKIAPIFDAVLVSYDMRHSSTPGVKQDYGEHKDHYGPLDLWLRHRAKTNLQTPVFIQLQQQEKNWREVIRQHDGNILILQYADNVLHISFQDMQDMLFTFPVKTLKD